MSCTLPNASCQPTNSCIRPTYVQFLSLSDVTEDYIHEHRRLAEEEMNFFRHCSELASVIEYAALSKLPSGKRHPHQRRIPKLVLSEAERKLQTASANLTQCLSFEELHTYIRQEIGGIRGIGKLTLYDVTTRIGAYLNLEPERVYLHAGTAQGAKALGLNHRVESLHPAALPQAFNQLIPREIEDCLCIYKDRFTGFNTQ